MNRGEFLKNLGLSSKALMAVYCLGAVTACGGSEDDPNPVNPDPGTNNPGTGTAGLTGTTSGTSIDFTVDLTHANYAKLKTQGEFLYVANIIIANAKGTMVALSKVCTHEGSTVQYRSAENDFLCPNHLSEFALDGSVEKSPAPSALKAFKTELTNSGNSLKVTA